MAGRAAGADSTAGNLRILHPAPDARYRLAPHLPASIQRIDLQAAAATPELFWFVNDLCVGRSTPSAPLSWQLQRGRHLITCSDRQGNSDRVQIEVD